MTSSIRLTASVRNNLQELTKTSKLLETATKRLTTGKKVNTALDNPTNYFKALSYNDRADGLTARLDDMSESVEIIKASDNGITNISAFLRQMKGVISDAQSTSDSDERRQLGKQFNELISQINSVAKDSSYGGLNLLSGNDSKTVQFSEHSGESTLKLDGINISAANVGLDKNGEVGSSGVTSTSTMTDADGKTSTVTDSFALSLDSSGEGVIGIKSAGTSGTAWSLDWGSADYQALLDGVGDQVEKMESSLKIESSRLANNLSIISTREDFTTNLIDILEDGATNLTAADTYAEAALVKMLQARQSITVQCLALASQNAQNALKMLS